MSGHDSPVNPRGVDLGRIAGYFEQKLAQHGATAMGVDYKSEDRQIARFEQFAAYMAHDERFSVLDVGCGYGAFWDYLRSLNKDFDYAGFDVSSVMIQEARRQHVGARNCRFLESLPADETADYVVASAIFNVMCGSSPKAWWDYVAETMTWMFARSRKAMACNFLTIYSDPERRGDNLFYAAPGDILDFCIKNLSKDVRLSHHYGIWDFTVCVLKND